ncbi:MAG: hypothetical protein VKK05_06755 [Synechococcus sp.]|jgi:hypothetical protein|nr:hypothetical protein [Synechococcus sp.]
MTMITPASEPSRSFPAVSFGLPFLAATMAIVMAGSGPLPVLAADRSMGPAWPVQGAPAKLLANQNDDKDKDKKKNKKKNQDPSSKRKSADQQRPSQPNSKQHLNTKQRERLYEKGYNSGWDDRRSKDRERWKAWDSNRWREYNRTKRNVWTRKVVVNNNYYSNPGWARSPGWYNNRPWGGNWYRVSSSPPWGWWAGQSLVWGITALTTAAIINNAIDRAIARQQASIYVPNTNWQLYYGSVQPVSSYGASFTVNNGYGSYQMDADCEQGLLNGEVPSSAAEAQLINAACQVTFGRGA